MVEEDKYPARRCQYWSDFEPNVCRYWDFKYRLCSYWQVTLDDGTLVKASYKGVDDYGGTLDGGEVPKYAIANIERPTKFPHCNMIGTDTWCKHYVSTTPISENGTPRCVLPDQSRHVVRRNSGKKWVQIRVNPVFSTLDKRRMLTAPYMTYTHINAYEKLTADSFPDPELDGKCEGLDDTYGKNGYCTMCEGYNPHHYQNTEDIGIHEGWGLEFSELRPEAKDPDYYPLPSPYSELDRPKEAYYVSKDVVRIEGDFALVIPDHSAITLYHEKQFVDDDGNNQTFIEDVNTFVYETHTEVVEGVTETFIVLEEQIAEPSLVKIYFGYSSINEFGVRLPLRYLIYNKRAKLARCYWWKGSSVDFTASIVENPSLPNMYYTDIKGWDISDYVSCEDPEHGEPADPDCPPGEPDKTDPGYVGCTCNDAAARIFYHPDYSFYNEEYHEIVPRCNGAKPECPFYTSSVCWEYCVDEKMQQGDRVLAEQILELRYYSRKDKWTEEVYNKSFNTPEIYSWAGPSKMQIDYSPTRRRDGYAIAAIKTYISNFNNFNLEKSDLILEEGTTNKKIPDYPSLVEIINEVRRAPIIRNLFDQDNNGNNVLEVTDLFHKYVLIFGEVPYYDVNTYAINMKDPELTGVFPKDLFKDIGNEPPTSMLEIENKEGMTEENYSSFYDDLDCALQMLTKFAPEKVSLSDCGNNNDMFIINADSFWGDNDVFVFNKGSGVWEFDKISFKKLFLGGVIAQTSFVVDSEQESTGKRKTLDYLPMYESSFMTSENNNGSITFDFKPFTSKWGGDTEIAYVYNDSVIESQMCRGLPDNAVYEPGKPYTFGNAFAERSIHIWQNSDAEGEFEYGLFKPYCDQGGMYMPQHQSGLLPYTADAKEGSLLGVISGHAVTHHLPSYPDEFNEAYEGDPTGLIYGPKAVEVDDKGNESFTGNRAKNLFYQLEASYKVYKILTINGFLYTDKAYHDKDDPVVECDQDEVSTCEGNMCFFGNAGYVLVTIPDENNKLSNYPMPWGIERLELKDDGSYEETGELMYGEQDTVVPLYVQNPTDQNNEKPYPILMEIAYKGGELPDNQIILKPKTENIYGLEPCSAFLRLKIYRFEKRSFGETPEVRADEEFEEIQDEILTSRPDITTVVYRSLDYERDEDGEPTGELLDSYDVPGEGANLTGAVRLKQLGSGANNTSYEITGFDVDPLLISVVFKSSLTGRIRGMSRTKMLTWVRQPYCRDIWINYSWQREYEVSGWNWYTSGEGRDKKTWLNIYDTRCIRDDIENQKWECFSTPYSPLYPYIDYAPVQYDYQFLRNVTDYRMFADRVKNVRYWGWMMSDLNDGSVEKSEFGLRCNPGFNPKISNEMLAYVRNYTVGHPAYYFRRHAYFTPQVWDYDNVPKHGFFDARMMVPSETQAMFTSYPWTVDHERKSSTRYYDYTSNGDDPRFVGLGMYMGGITEFEKDEYYCFIGDKTAYALQGHDVLWCGFVGYTPMAVYSGRKQYGGDIGFYHDPTGTLVKTAYKYDQLPKWFPFNEMKPYPLKFGNVCRDYLSSFRSMDNIYYDKPGRIAAAAYPDVKVRRERMIDPNKTGIFNGENPKTSGAYSTFRAGTPREEISGFAGVNIPDYYYRKWVPINYSYTDCDITGSNVADYPFDLYTGDYDSPFIHPMGLFLAEGKIENIEIKEEIYMETGSEGDPTDVYARFAFEEVFGVDKLDTDSFDGDDNKNPYATSSEVSITHPAARYYEDDLERSIFWYVYRPFPIPSRYDDYDELKGKPADWGEGVDTSVDEEVDPGGSKLAIHWVWREHWKDLERQVIELSNLKACELQAIDEEETGVNGDTFEPTFNDPFQIDPLDIEKNKAIGRFLFLGLQYPDYQMDGDLFEHRLVCTEGIFSSLNIGANYKIKFIPPPRTEKGRYDHHVFFIQLLNIDGTKVGPPRGFTIGSDPLQDPETVGRWDPEAMLGGDEELEIPGYNELSAKDVYDLYTECCGSKDQVIDDWMRVNCPYCDGTGTVGLQNDQCPICYGEERVSPITLLAPGYTDSSITAAEFEGRITKRFIDGEYGYEIEEAVYHRGLYAELFTDKFEFLPKITKILDERLYSICFALADINGNAETVLPETVNGEFVVAGEYNNFNSVILEAPYNCSNNTSDFSNVIFDLVMSGSSTSITDDDGNEQTPQLRNVNKIILEFEVGTEKDPDTDGIILYHEPAIKILASEKGTKTYLTYSENMTLTEKPAPGKAVGIIDVITRVCKWELTVDDYFDPLQYIRVEMRLKPTEEELIEQGLSSYYNNTNVTNKVKLRAAYLFESSFVEATENIRTYERKYNISVGGYGDIYPNRFVPNKNEEGELKHNLNGNVGRWHHPENINVWETGLYPPRQNYRDKISSVYEEDSPEGIIGHNNEIEDTTVELAYMSKCRGRICSEVSESGSPLSGQGTPRRFSGTGGNAPAASLDATEGSVEEVHEWEKLQEKNYNKVTGHAGGDNIKDAGNALFQMTSVCPPGLKSVLEEMGVSEFPSWKCTFVNTFVPPLTPTIQYTPYNHEGSKVAPIRMPDIDGASRYSFQVRPLFYERNKELVPYHDWDYELENREMLRLQKEYYYNTIVPAQPWEETTFNYPYPVDAFHTIIRNNENHSIGWGCPAPELGDGWQWIYHFDTWWLGKGNYQSKEIYDLEDTFINWKPLDLFPDPTQGTFYNSIDDHIESYDSPLYPTRLVVDKKVLGGSGQGTSFIDIPKRKAGDSTDYYVPYLL